jgi:hypothetical protein
MSNRVRSLIRGEVPRAERIRELLANCVDPEAIAQRVGCKPSEIWRQRGVMKGKTP